MRRLVRASLMMATIALAATACGGEEDDGTTTINGLTFMDVQRRVLDALFPSGAVMHTRETFPVDVELPPRDIWRSADTAEGHIDGRFDSAPTIFRDGKRYAVSQDGLLTEEETATPLPQRELLGSAGSMLDAGSAKMKLRTIDGVEAIRIVMPAQCIDSPCGPNILYVDAATFLPIQTGEKGHAQFTHERIAREALPADFFSPDAVIAFLEGIPSPPESWRALGNTPYWLGPSFDGLVPSAGIPTRTSGAASTSSTFTIGYGSAGATSSSGGCVSIIHHTDQVPPLPGPIENLGTVDAPVGAVTIYRHENEWAGWHALEGGGTLVAWTRECAEPNPLASLDAMTRIAYALRPYDGPLDMAAFAKLSAETP